MSKQFDAIIIGTGQAGPSLAARLSSAGWKVAVLERKRFGGTCVNNGCIPTKALIASARAAYVARQASNYGVVIDSAIHVDMKKIKARKDEIVKPSTEGVQKWMEGLQKCTVFHGHGRFESAHTVRVGDEMLEAEKIFINVGARAHQFKWKSAEQFQHDGCRFSARASGDCWRKLHRSGVWANVPPFRQRSDNRGNGLEFDRP
jgi:pyruvate/2-oxoglutarate dehydrogenase complex dihydrolipoamide dehydrogenase (E3) component